MPFDPFAPTPATRTRHRRAVATWLFVLCAMLLVMIGLGGATRLTGSGLSIMEWAPLSGALPPMSQAEWERLFALYREIPQYHLLHEGFGLAGFQQIFWLEWIHRLWGRLLGVALLVPLALFWWRGAIDRRLAWRLAGLFVLGALQGVVGWVMVSSGWFADSTAVSQYRLVAHLSLALALYAALLWTALSILRPAGRDRLLLACATMIGLTIVAGGFVAGLHGGLVYNEFPLMGATVVPAELGDLSPWWRNPFENAVTAQFDHRILATLTALLVLYSVALRLRRGLTAPLIGLAGAVGLQYALGVATLLAMVPIPFAVAHQVCAALLLTAALVALHASRKDDVPHA